MVRTVTLAFLLLGVISASGQNLFSDLTDSLVYTETRSGSPFAVADMNADGLDDIVRLHIAQILRIEYQQFAGGFTGYAFGNLLGSGNEWGIAIADVDENGYNDIITGGFNNDLKLLLANSSGTGYTQTTLPEAPPPPQEGTALQACNFVDINNDGKLDFFACDDIGLSDPYRGNNDGTFVWDTTLINPESTIPSDNSGNYGSVWTDYDWDGDLDLFITKCRGGVFDPLDGRRLNLMFENDGNNEFTEVAEEIGLRPLSQSWSTDFGDLDNDGDMDALIIQHTNITTLYYNDGTNHYVAMNDSAGITADLQGVTQGIQVIMEDFDNDGLQDILVTSREGQGHKLFWNQGAMQFVHYDSVFPADMTTNIHSAAVGDLNHDGFIDIMAGHGFGYNSPSGSITDDLLINDGNDNHFISVRTMGDASHINGIGTRLVIVSDLGRQQRDIRSGESYGIMNSFNAHFGLGPDTHIDSMIVYWPSGETDLYENLRADQFLTIYEGAGPCDCNAPAVKFVTELSGTGPGSLPYEIDAACPCDTVRLASFLAMDTIVLDERLQITRDIVIQGLGSSQSFISTTTNSPGIRIQPGVHCTLSEITLTDGAEVPPVYLIENGGILTLDGLTVNRPPGLALKAQSGTWIAGPGLTIFQ